MKKAPITEKQQAYNKAHRAREARTATRIATTRSVQYRNTGLSAPKWNREETQGKLRQLRDEQKKNPGVFEIDHIVPLRGKVNRRRSMVLVCGLHTADNLRITTKQTNSRKSCVRWPDMWDYSTRHLKELYRLWDTYCEAENLGVSHD